MEWTSYEITSYLKTATELESSKYTQERIVVEAEASVKMREVSRKVPCKPKDLRLSIKKPVEPVQIKDTSAKKFILIGCAVLLATVAFAVLAYTSSVKSTPQSPGSGLTILAGGCALVLFFIGLFCVLLGVSKRQAEKESNEQARSGYKKANEAYQFELQRAEEEYDNAIRAYNDSEEAYARDYKTAKEGYEKAKAGVETLKPVLAETTMLLEQLYSNDLIYPKYRNLAAIATMYEYFASGRVTELTGPHGAYNLYEQELRQNLIINQLDKIASHLEEIRDNQYVLYEAVCQSNQALSEVVGELKSINSGMKVVAAQTKGFASSTRTAAFHSEIIAKNTEAIKYIELVTQ